MAKLDRHVNCSNATNSALSGTDFSNTLNGSTTQACTCINHRPISSVSIGNSTDDSTAAVVGIGPSLDRYNACQHHYQSQIHTGLISHSMDRSTKEPYGNQDQSLDTAGYAVDHLAFGDATAYFSAGADIPRIDNDGHYCSHEVVSRGLSDYTSFTSSPFDSEYCSEISKQRSFPDAVMGDSHLEGCSHHYFRSLPRLHHETHASTELQAGLPSSTVRIEEPTGAADAQRASLDSGVLSSKSKRLIHRYLLTFFH